MAQAKYEIRRKCPICGAAFDDHLSEGIQIFLIASDKSYTSCHSHQIKVFVITEHV